ARQDKRIGQSLGARVELYGLMDSDVGPLSAEQWKELLIVSDVRLQGSAKEAPADALRFEASAVAAAAAAGQKCERCWHIREDVGRNAAYPGVCGRCAPILAELELEG
ncbi:MAG: zinc finger domain-containing protein, partial [Bacilli bacterium]